jgi:hypothetical protein
MRLYWKTQYPWIAIDTIDESFDPATAEMHYVMDGQAQMRWTKAKEGQPRFLETDGYSVAAAPKAPSRKKGLNDDAPVKVAAFPDYVRSTETIRLPNDGKGISVIGRPVDETVAGTAMKRTFAVKDGVFTLETTERTVSPEIPLAEAMSGVDELKALSVSRVFLQAQPGTPVGDSGGATAVNGTPAAGQGDAQVVASGHDAVWSDPDAVAPGTHHDALPDTGTPPVDTLDGLTRLYSGFTRN